MNKQDRIIIITVIALIVVFFGILAIASSIQAISL